jgi:hypothetical protein
MSLTDALQHTKLKESDVMSQAVFILNCTHAQQADH